MYNYFIKSLHIQLLNNIIIKKYKRKFTKIILKKVSNYNRIIQIWRKLWKK